ncbi:hypothetical protein HDV06_006811 [Boothiomyces sp. JEL0866]|nr:hypothetical protein HDV06_006811 [Boothiomyces sp. JEL0866]
MSFQFSNPNLPNPKTKTPTQIFSNVNSKPRKDSRHFQNFNVVMDFKDNFKVPASNSKGEVGKSELFKFNDVATPNSASSDSSDALSFSNQKKNEPQENLSRNFSSVSKDAINPSKLTTSSELCKSVANDMFPVKNIGEAATSIPNYIKEYITKYESKMDEIHKVHLDFIQEVSCSDFHYNQTTKKTKSQLTFLQKQVADLKQKLSQAENDIKLQMETKDSFSSQISSLEKSRQSLVDAIQKLNEQKETLELDLKNALKLVKATLEQEDMIQQLSIQLKAGNEKVLDISNTRAKVEAEFSCCRTNLGILQEKCKLLETELSARSVQLNEAKIKDSQLTAEIAREKDKAVHLQELATSSQLAFDLQVTQKTNQINNLELEVGKLEKELTMTQAKLDEAQSALQANSYDFKLSIDSLTKELHNKHANIVQIQEKYDEILKERNQYQLELSSTKEIVESHRKERAGLLGQLEKLQSEFKQYQTDHEFEAEECEDLKLKLSEAVKLSNCVSIKFESLDDRFASLQAANESLNSTNHQLQQEIQTLAQSLSNQTSNDLESNLKERNRTKELVDQLKCDNNNLRSQISELKMNYENELHQKKKQKTKRVKQEPVDLFEPTW